MVLSAYDIMTMMKRMQDYAVVISMIDELLEKLNKLISTKFPDTDDIDIIEYKASAQKMIHRLEFMKSNLQL
jgi:hypothetical protein